MRRGTALSRFVLAGISLTISASVALSQEPSALPNTPTTTPQTPVFTTINVSPPTTPATYAESGSQGLFNFNRENSGYLNGTHDFDRFIGFLSNPLQSIDPRATTEIWPMFGSSWVSGNGPLLADANAQIYGAGLNVALSDRLSFGFNQGGYAVANISSDRERILQKLGLPVPDRDFGGQREGWLNLGGFVQYTVIADACNQFILTAGLRWEAPSGATQVFQGGDNPPYLAPYLTAGKEFGCWHLLGTTGFEFPCGSGQATTDTLYLNLHLDRQIGWFYPLVELNGSYHTTTVDLNLPARHEVLDMGTFSSTGNMLMLAVGANAVLIPNKLEFGACYMRPISAQDQFEYNGMLMKLTYRY
jgi:hypothetical protein